MPYVNVELELYALVEYLEKQSNTAKDALDKLNLIVDRI